MQFHGFGHINIGHLKSHVLPHDFYNRELSKDFWPQRTRSWVDGGLCPFHSDRSIGSFKINLDNGAFKCFSCDSSGGDIIAFRMLKDGLDFRGALIAIANEYGV